MNYNNYNNNDYLELAISELKATGIIKSNYSPNRIKLYESSRNFHIGDKEFYYSDCRFCLFDNPNIMPFVTDEMKEMLKYYHTSNKPFKIGVVVPSNCSDAVKSLEKPYLFNYYSYRYDTNTIVDRPNYIDYKFDERRFDRSDIHLKYMPAIFESYYSSHYKTFTTADEVKKEIDKDINSFNKFMVVAKPYISGEKDNVYTELTKQKADIVKAINTLQDKLWQKESKLAEINHQFEEIDEKIKTEFSKKMSIEEDFNG